MRFPVFVFALLLSVSAVFAVPQLSYQGYLTDAAGKPLADGTYSLSFAFYDLPSGETPAFMTSSQDVTVTGGLFSVEIYISGWLFSVHNDVYIGTTVNGGDEMPLRAHLAMVGYAGAADWALTSHVADSSYLADHANRALIADTAAVALAVSDTVVTQAVMAKDSSGLRLLSKSGAGLVVDSLGNLFVGPSSRNAIENTGDYAVVAAGKAIRIGSHPTVPYGYVVNNASFEGGELLADGVGQQLILNGKNTPAGDGTPAGGLAFQVTPAGVAGDKFSYTTVLSVDTNGNMAAKGTVASAGRNIYLNTVAKAAACAEAAARGIDAKYIAVFANGQVGSTLPASVVPAGYTVITVVFVYEIENETAYYDYNTTGVGNGTSLYADLDDPACLRGKVVIAYK